jgi:tetratricopeptide (TPR) repeat protein
LDPTSVPIAWYKGVAFFSLEDFTRAKQQFELANTIHPYNIHVMNNLASCYEKLNRHDQAIRYYRKALHYSSGFEEARLNLSAVYYNTKAYEKAFQTIDRCDTSSTDPKYATFLPAILSKKAELSLKGQNDTLLIHRLNTLKGNNELLVKAYLSAKRKKVPFGKFLLQSD